MHIEDICAAYWETAEGQAAERLWKATPCIYSLAETLDLDTDPGLDLFPMKQDKGCICHPATSLICSQEV